MVVVRGWFQAVPSGTVSGLLVTYRRRSCAEYLLSWRAFWMHLQLKIAEASVLWGREAARRRKMRKKEKINFSSNAAEEQPWAPGAGEMQACGPGYFSVGGSLGSKTGCSRRPSWSGVEQTPLTEQFRCTCAPVPAMSCCRRHEERGFAEEDARWIGP